MKEILLAAIFIVLFMILLKLDSILDRLDREEITPEEFGEIPAYVDVPAKEEKAKTVVYNPQLDPISEFTGKKDDWYGGE